MSYRNVFEAHKAECDRIMNQISETTEDWFAEDIANFYGYTEHGTEDHLSVAHLEQALGVSIPVALRDVYLIHGGFSIFDSDRHLALNIPTITELIGCRDYVNFAAEWPSLFGALVTYGSRSEFHDNLDPQQLKVLTENYFVFGMANHRYEDRTFLVFTRDGLFGNVKSEHDWGSEEWDAEYLPLCDGKLNALSINEVLEPHILACTNNLRQRLMEDNW